LNQTQWIITTTMIPYKGILFVKMYFSPIQQTNTFTINYALPPIEGLSNSYSYYAKITTKKAKISFVYNLGRQNNTTLLT
jgi:hypothetical protein